jgi:hypothetical protein
MSNVFVPHIRTGLQERDSFSGTLLFITKETCLDYSFIDLENGTTFVTPIERENYRFYVKSRGIDNYGNYINGIVSTRLFTVCRDGHSVLRGDLTIGETTTEEMYNAYKRHYYIPVNKKTTIDIHRNWNGRKGYNFYINGCPVGFVSEYGEYEDFHEKAEGLMQFFFEDCPQIRKSKNDVIPNFKRDFQFHRNLIEDSFPNFKGTLHSVEQMEIVGITKDQEPDYMVRKTENGETKYYIVRHTPLEKRIATNENFQLMNIDPTRLAYSCGNRIKHSKFKSIFYTDAKEVGGMLDLRKGFGIDTDKIDEIATIKTLHTCIFVRNKITEFSTYENR